MYTKSQPIPIGKEPKVVMFPVSPVVTKVVGPVAEEAVIILKCLPAEQVVAEPDGNVIAVPEPLSRTVWFLSQVSARVAAAVPAT